MLKYSTAVANVYIRGNEPTSQKLSIFMVVRCCSLWLNDGNVTFDETKFGW